jgi:hypothetical protein
VRPSETMCHHVAPGVTTSDRASRCYHASLGRPTVPPMSPGQTARHHVRPCPTPSDHQWVGEKVYAREAGDAHLRVRGSLLRRCSFVAAPHSLSLVARAGALSSSIGRPRGGDSKREWVVLSAPSSATITLRHAAPSSPSKRPLLRRGSSKVPQLASVNDDHL